MRLERFFIILGAIFALSMLCSCGGSESTLALCDCQPDEYCVNDECIKTDAAIAPLPEETDSSKSGGSSE